MRARGFTLIELVMVMVLLSVVSVVAFISLGSYKSHHLSAAAEKVAVDLRYAKNLALSSTTWHGVSFQSDPTNTYNLYETDGSTDTNIKGLLDASQDFIANIKDDYAGVVISSVNISGGSKVEFDPHGVPYNDKAGAVLASNGVITLSLGSSSLTVQIASETGRIYIQ